MAFEPSSIPAWQGRPSSRHLRELVGALARLDSDVDDAERLAQLRALEEIKNAAAAAQARVAVDFDASQRRHQAAAGVPLSERGRGVAAQIALARRESRHRGSRLMGLARLLVEDLPHTLAAMQRGEVSEWRATLVAKSAVVLDAADRALLDEEIGPRLESRSDREVDAAARAVAYRVDPAAVVRRAGRAAADRRVTVRPAPDVMAIVSACLPAVQGVAVYKALSVAAASAKAQGDPRRLDQLRADTLVELVTGQRTASGVPLEVGLVMTDAALLGRADDLARIEAYGPVPAAAAREAIAHCGTVGEPVAGAEWKPVSADGSERAPRRGVGAAAGRGGVDAAGRGGVDAAGRGGVDAAGRGGVGAAARGGVEAAGRGGVEAAGRGGVEAAERGGVEAAERGGVDAAERGGVDAAERGAVSAAERCASAGAPAEGVPEQAAEGAPWRDAAPSGDEAETVAVWVRRLFLDPFDASVAHVDTRRRLFSGAVRRLVLARDPVCRTPWCDAPVRDIDHVVPHRSGGATSAANAQGLCRACNLDKTAPGWHAVAVTPASPRGPSAATDSGERGPSPLRLTPEPDPSGSPAGRSAATDSGERGSSPLRLTPEPDPSASHVVRTTTPSGATYSSTVAPVLPGIESTRRDGVEAERRTVPQQARGAPPGEQSVEPSAS